MRAPLALICLALLMLATCACSADMVLVRDGQPLARVIVPVEPHDMVTIAAEELNLYLGRMSGAQLPISSDAAGDGPALYLGAPDEVWAERADLASLAFDGFVVGARATAWSSRGMSPRERSTQSTGCSRNWGCAGSSPPSWARTFPSWLR